MLRLICPACRARVTPQEAGFSYDGGLYWCSLTTTFVSWKNIVLEGHDAPTIVDQEQARDFPAV